MAQECIGIVGAGVMGRGIAQLMLQAGHEVRMFDAARGAAQAAQSAVVEMIDKLTAKGRIAADARALMVDRLAVVDAIEGLSGCSVILEAVVEDLHIKQGLFRDLERVVATAAILASNTSSLTISAIASVCDHPERVAGLHFFNPVPLMKITEIIPGLLTGAAVIERLRNLITGTGHRAVVAADQPGFLVNHAGRALYTEGFRIIEERCADVVTVDRVMREGCGFRMGPFELLDLTGLDVSSKVMQSIYEQFQQEPRYRPSPLVAPRVAARLFGRKTGRGFYTYEGTAKNEPDEQAAPSARPGKLWIGDGVVLDDRLEIPEIARVGRPDDADVIIIAPIGEDVSSAVARLGLDARRTVAVDPFIPAGGRQTLMHSPATLKTTIDMAQGWLARKGSVSVIADGLGAIAQRILAMIVNTGCEIAQRGIASPSDIDSAVRIGLGYPEGPLALGDRLGPSRILQLLERMQEISGDPRYRPSAWLRRRALLGIPLAEG